MNKIVGKKKKKKDDSSNSEPSKKKYDIVLSLNKWLRTDMKIISCIIYSWS